MRTIYYTRYIRKAYPNELYHGYSTELYHHGIKGQKWGVRRYQNPDGTLTTAGKIHYRVMATVSSNKFKREGAKRRLKENKIISNVYPGEKEFSDKIKKEGFVIEDQSSTWDGKHKQVSYTKNSGSKKYPELVTTVEWSSNPEHPLHSESTLKTAKRIESKATDIADSAIKKLLADTNASGYGPTAFGYSNADEYKKKLRPIQLDTVRNELVIDNGTGWITVDFDPNTYKILSFGYDD